MMMMMMMLLLISRTSKGRNEVGSRKGLAIRHHQRRRRKRRRIDEKAKKEVSKDLFDKIEFHISWSIDILVYSKSTQITYS
jgi:hypothetical protein